MEAALAERPWFAGDALTAADVMMSFPLEAAVSRGGLGPSRPNTMAWLERIHARPAYQKALEAGAEDFGAGLKRAPPGRRPAPCCCR